MPKKRTSETKTGNRGLTAIQQYCDNESLIFQGEPREDAGVDCYIEVELEREATNFLIGVQCKTGPSYRRDRKDGSFIVSVSADDVAYWAAANIPVLFVYYDTTEKAIYWKHVQALVGGANSLSEIKHLTFTALDNAQNSSLAEYARHLVNSTPSTRDRVAIFASTMACDVDGCSTMAGPSASVTTADFSEEVLPLYTSVIGYSSDDRWILLREFVDRDPLPPEIYAIFLDTTNWASLRLPIAVHPKDDPEADTLPPDPNRVREATEVMKKIGFFRPQVLLFRHDFVHDSSTTPKVAFVFGQEKFEISVVVEHKRQALVLENARFSPPRRATILASATVPMPYIGTDFMPIGNVQQLRGVCEVAVSPSGKTVSIAAITNLSHECWGALAVFHVHLASLDVRRACCDALLV